MYEKQEYQVIGNPAPRTDAAGQVTGMTQYVCDLTMPGMLYAKAVFSTEHHARLLSVDTSEAERLPGVCGVVTAKDAPEYLYGATIMDTPCLARDKVRYKGEMIACVAAETYETACRAAELVKVEYERLPAVFDPREALKPDAPLIHEDLQGIYYDGNRLLPGNSPYLKLRTGDIEKGFAESDVILEREFSTCTQKALPIEPFATLAAPDAGGGISIWSTQQCVFRNAKHIAALLGIPVAQVRFMAPCVGGAFGEKNQPGTEPAAALLAMKTGRPVKLEFTTKESLLHTGTKHPVYFHMKLGAKKDGTLMALKRECVTGAGAYSSVAKEISLKVAYWGSGSYYVPNQWTDVHIVCTNRQIGSAMRGFGMGQTTFAIEVMMDMLAEELGIDPLTLRKRNMYREGGVMSTGQTVRAAGIGMVLDMVAEAAGMKPDV